MSPARMQKFEPEMPRVEPPLSVYLRRGQSRALRAMYWGA